MDSSEPRALRYPDAIVWLDRLFDRGYMHGFDLVMSLGGPCARRKYGLTDNGPTAIDILRAFRDLGWIRSTGFAPSRDQMFFGFGGVSYDTARRPQNAGTRAFHLETHGWAPVRGVGAEAWLAARC